jgi:hypothetical protein
LPRSDQIPLIPFEKGQRKEDVMAERLRHFDQEEGVVFLGRAQEKAPVFRTEKRRNPQTSQRYPWIVRSTAMVNHYYWYGLDRDCGPFFLKFCSYFPYRRGESFVEGRGSPLRSARGCGSGLGFVG